MKRAGNLMELIADPDNLRLAFCKAAKGKEGKREVQRFRQHLDRNLLALRNGLLDGTVEVGRYHYFMIYDPKQRLICAASFPERVLHHAIMNVCHPYFERNFIYDTYATRIGKGTYAALNRAFRGLSRYGYVAKMDVRKYFDSISHSVLKQKLKRLFKDNQLLCLFDRIIDSYHTHEGYGVPIGNLTSQYFANFYLSEIDHFAKEELKIPLFVRYMDDILLMGDDRNQLKIWADGISHKAESLELQFKPSTLFAAEAGCSFLGYRICRHKIAMNSRSRRRMIGKWHHCDSLLEQSEMSEDNYERHIVPLLAFASHAYTKRLRTNILKDKRRKARTA